MKTETKERYIKSSEAEELELMKEPQSETDIMYEDTRKREKNTKHFRLKNGNYRAVIYDHPVHKYDEESGRFVDIPTDYGETENDYEAEFENYKVKFPKKDGKRRFITVNKGDKRFSWRYAFEKEGERNTRASAHLHSVNKNKWDNERAHIKYEKIDGKSDLEYSVNDGGIKESIILSECPENSVFSFEIKMHGLVPRLSENKKRVELVSDKAEFETAEAEMVIPEPNMIDNNGAYSEELHYEIRKTENGTFLDVVANNAWLADPDRVYPVTVDPVVEIKGSSYITTYTYKKGLLSNPQDHFVGVVNDGDGECNASRMYITLDISLPVRNPRIKNAGITFRQKSESLFGATSQRMGLYRTQQEPIIGEFEPYNDNTLIDFELQKASDGVEYTFDITTLVDEMIKGESDKEYLVLKLIDETQMVHRGVTIYGSNSGISTMPTVTIDYESSYGVNTSARAHTHELGRFGKGSIDLQCGNLMFESEDFAWSGNLMPVTIKHFYNSALAKYQYTYNNNIRLYAGNFSSMNIGKGYKLNIMQSIHTTPFVHDGTNYARGFVYIAENGEEIYFRPSNPDKITETKFEDINGNGMIYHSDTHKLIYGDHTYTFDSEDSDDSEDSENYRLIKIQDSSGNAMEILYDGNGRIYEVVDGVGRKFDFEYTGTEGNEVLSSITAPNNTKIYYGYTDLLLTSITYPDGRKAEIAYTPTFLTPRSVTLKNATNDIIYKVEYGFVGERLTLVKEIGSDNTVGARTEYSYLPASATTVVDTIEKADDNESEDNVIRTVYTFSDGEIVSEYINSRDTGNITSTGGTTGINPYKQEGGVNVVLNSNNIIFDHSFEQEDNDWLAMPNNNTEKFEYKIEEGDWAAKFGIKALRMKSTDESIVANGIYQQTIEITPGEYTFSAYLRPLTDIVGGSNPGIYLRVCDLGGNCIAESERLSKKIYDYTRIALTFENEDLYYVTVQILMDGRGQAYVDGAQLEKNPFASPYNFLTNGSIEADTDRVYAWESTDGVECCTDVCFNESASIAIQGKLETERYACQTINVQKLASTRETFTLSGWAKGYALPARERDGSATPYFRLKAIIHYVARADQIVTSDFKPCTYEWQFTSVQFAKELCESVRDITVYCEYSNNASVAYFDDIRLVRDSIEKELSKSDFVSTNVEYEEETTEENTLVDVDNDSLPEFEEKADSFGNNITETTYKDGEWGTIYRSFGFSENGNDLIRETDARGNDIVYTVNPITSTNEEIIDRCGNKTVYEYDDAGRTTKVTNKKADGTDIANVSYGYDDFDNPRKITRGDGMEYELKYNAFHNLESIGITGKTDGDLIKYTYKNGNGRLKQMTYANGDTMKATYNSIGQMISEKWYNSSNLMTAGYKYTYDGNGNVVRSVDILQEKEYNYLYENGMLIRALEYDATISDETVTAKVLVNTVLYTYDAKGNPATKTLLPASGESFKYYYECNDENTVLKFSAGGNIITSSSNNNSFGRKEFDELQLATDVISRKFTYYNGKVTDEHKDNAKVKSAPTTQLVKQIEYSDGRTILYEYDAEERITKITDSIDGVTEYTYDAQGQLLTETVNANLVNTMTYDGYGNIASKNGKFYTYDYVWKDQLICYDAQCHMIYDAQGNPTSYLGHTLTWEKGRQLKSFDSNTYTYNANGIRTSKTVNGVKHEYTLDGTKILRETWDDNTLIPLYNNEDSVCGILYNNVSYYFIKNLQGDVIAIVDKDAQTVARYSYDAWGVCTVTQDSVDIATINPFRYRGYYYDEDITLYYLQSRYYDASVGRFINVDSPAYVGAEKDCICSNNLQCYCKNNAINLTDSAGYFAIELVIGAIYGAIMGVLGYFLDIILSNFFKILKNISNFWGIIKKEIVWWKLLAAVTLGAMSGALSTTNKKKLITTIANMLSSLYAAITSGLGVFEAVITGVIIFIIQELMSTAQSFSKFNFKKVKNSGTKTLKNLGKSQLSQFTKTLSNAIIYYIKSNSTLYKRYFAKYAGYTIAQWLAALGIKGTSTLVKCFA